MTLKNIRTDTPPNLVGQPDNKLFRVNDFDSIIFQKGYDVILEQALLCPCAGRSGSAKPSCLNCLGYGWIFINPLSTKAIISSINFSTKYKDWSAELIGTISVTVRDEQRLSFMDKITFKTRSSILSEIRPVIISGENRFIFTSYKVKKINALLIYSSDSVKLINVPKDKFNLLQGNDFIIKIDSSFVLPVNFNGVVSVEYEHEISYNVIDLPHDFRSTFTLNNNGQQVESYLPIQAIARRSHIVLGEPTNYSGNNLINNNSL